MHYCYVYNKEKQLNFHGWLSNVSIKELELEGSIVEIQDYKYENSVKECRL